MVTLAKMAVAGIAGLFVLKLLAGLLLPLVGLAVGVVGVAVKVAVVLLVGWFVLSILRRRKREPA